MNMTYPQPRYWYVSKMMIFWYFLNFPFGGSWVKPSLRSPGFSIVEVDFTQLRGVWHVTFRQRLGGLGGSGGLGGWYCLWMKLWSIKSMSPANKLDAPWELKIVRSWLISFWRRYEVWNIMKSMNQVWPSDGRDCRWFDWYLILPFVFPKHFVESIQDMFWLTCETSPPKVKVLQRAAVVRDVAVISWWFHLCCFNAFCLKICSKSPFLEHHIISSKGVLKLNLWLFPCITLRLECCFTFLHLSHARGEPQPADGKVDVPLVLGRALKALRSDSWRLLLEPWPKKWWTTKNHGNLRGPPPKCHPPPLREY